MSHENVVGVLIFFFFHETNMVVIGRLYKGTVGVPGYREATIDVE